MMAQNIPESHMQIIRSAKNYEEAIRVASKPLLEYDYITEEYVQAMIDSIEEHGPYIVLADDFALPHARPSEAVKETGLSLLTVKEGVDLKGNTVKLFVVLAAKDSSSHNEMLQSLAEFLMDKQNIKDVVACNTVKDIKTILNERWN